ncbi:MAG: GNAT family N-acetyltransferase [Alphaproteobacteria bacterium]
MFRKQLEDVTPPDLEAGHVDIVTDRLRLSPVGPEHRDAVVVALSDEDVARNLAQVPFPYTADHFDAFLKEFSKNSVCGEMCLAISDWKTGVFLGLIGLRRGNPHPEIGYWLAKTYWGKGIMKEAAAALLDHVFAISDEPVIYSGHFVDNPRSGKVLSFLGFRETGNSKVHSLARGEDVDHRDMELTREAYFGIGTEADGGRKRARTRGNSYAMDY